MKINPEEISSVIKQHIQDFDARTQIAETGTVVAVGDGAAQIYGLQRSQAGELVEFANGVTGLVLNLEEGSVGVCIMGSSEGIKEGDPVKRTGRIADTIVGDELLGRVVNGLGHPIDGQQAQNDTFQSNLGLAKFDVMEEHHSAKGQKPGGKGANQRPGAGINNVIGVPTARG